MRPLKANVFDNFSHPSNQKKPMPHIQKKNLEKQNGQKLPNYEK
jgi:hypothetical protein